jgi:hypothetical protein
LKNKPNNSVEQLRSTFVEYNEGKITLTTHDSNDKYNWDDFFDQIKVKIAEDTKNDVCQLLTAEFSTTGKVESILSNACIMNIFKFYF